MVVESTHSIWNPYGIYRGVLSTASPEETSNGKRKLDDNAEEGPIEKKRKKSAAPKKKGGARRKGWAKGTDVEATPAQEDMDAEGEQVEE